MGSKLYADNKRRSHSCLLSIFIDGAGVSPCAPPPLSDSYATVCLCSSSSIFSKSQPGVVRPTRLSGLIVGKVSA